MSIKLEYEEEDVKEAHGAQAVRGDTDFSSKKELKGFVENMFESFQCPNCGGHQVSGRINVKLGKVKFFQEELTKSFWGSKKYVNRHVEDIWRVYDVYLKPGGFLTSAGNLECKSCKWNMRGITSKVVWYSLNDIFSGNFKK